MTDTSVSTQSPVLGVVRLLQTPYRWVERSSGFARTLLIASYVIAGLSIVTIGFRQTRLLGLPAGQPPFDTAAFLAESIPEDSNAFGLFAKAMEDYVPPVDTGVVLAVFRNTPPGTTPIIPNEARDWLKDNARAIEEFKQAWDRPDAMDTKGRAGISSNLIGMNDIYNRLCSALFVKAQESIEADNHSEAWECYRSVLRSTWLISRHSGEAARMLGGNTRARLLRRLKGWTEDTNVDAGVLRQALADVQSMRNLVPDEREALKIAYLNAVRNHETFYNGSAEQDGPPLEPGGFVLGSDINARYYAFKRWVRRDRERSLRLLQLAYANWLAYLDLPEEQRPKPTVRVATGVRNQGIPFEFYTIPGSGSMDPMRLGKWLITSLELRQKLATLEHYKNMHRQEISAHNEIVLQLANQIYRREHSGLPEHQQQLVGTVLDELPEVRFETYDDTIPILKVEDTQADLD